MATKLSERELRAKFNKLTPSTNTNRENQKTLALTL